MKISKNRSLLIAKTIITQLGPRLLLEIGASNFYTREKGVQFDVKKRNSINKIVIDLYLKTDLYNIGFYNVPKSDPTKFKTVNVIEQIFVDQLITIINDNLSPREKNPKAKTGNFTLRTLARDLSAEKFAHRLLSFQRSGQYSELRGIQKGKKFNIVGYKWPDKSVRRKLNIGRARKNPNQSKGPTPNQVNFGQRGKIKVGWINRETPTRYQITYKDGYHTKQVWRKKTSVTLLSKKKQKNPCKRYANPTGKKMIIKKAVDISEKFHRLAPRRVTFNKIKMPTALVQLGECCQINYITDKWDGKTREYYHKFDNKAVLYASDRKQLDGQQMLIIIGNFKIESAGIVG